jgi:hypothetical protein
MNTERHCDDDNDADDDDKLAMFVHIVDMFRIRPSSRMFRTNIIL